MVLDVLVYFSSFIIGIVFGVTLGATVVFLITMGYLRRFEKKLDRILAALEQSR